MKTWYVALKDLRRSFRSLFALVFMFAVPIMVTTLFYFMFGGTGAEEEAYDLPRTQVEVANLDAGSFTTGGLDLAGVAGLEQAGSMGAVIVDLLEGESFADLLVVTEAPDAEAARAAVDAGEAGVAVILPADLTAALTEPDARTSIELYSDPTLTLGPSIVEGIMRQLVDRLAASKIGIAVTIEQLATSGVAPEPALIEEVVAAYTEGSAAGNGEAGRAGGGSLVQVVSPAGVEAAEESNPIASALGLIMGGMLIFFAFFTGAYSMQSILTEAEEGTLARLFTTPTPARSVLTGKFLATLVILIVQVSVLFTFGNLVFGIEWGQLGQLALLGGALVIIAASTGAFIVSLLKSTRQGGVVFGGLMTITGMLGMAPIFTAGVTEPPAAVQTAALIVPQGWAVRGLMQVMDGVALGALLLTVGGMLVWSAVFFFVGQYRLQRRFA